MPSLHHPVTVISRCTVVPHQKSTLVDLKLSVSDLPMLSCHYIQKGCLFTRHHTVPLHALLPHLKRSLSVALSRFPPLAGRLSTDSHGHVFSVSDDSGADFFFAEARSVHVRDVIGGIDVPEVVKGFFSFDGAVSYEGHYRPILAVQVTELADGVFIGCSVNHSITDGTSFWNFFNTFAEVSRAGMKIVTRQPDFTRESVLISQAVLKVPPGGPKVTFNVNEPLRERIFSFSREAITELKATVNSYNKKKLTRGNGDIDGAELMGKQSNDKLNGKDNAKLTEMLESLFARDDVVSVVEKKIFSSFQSLCALLWRAITRARKLPSSKTTTFRMAVNCRQRLSPKLNPYYFGNAIQSIPTYAAAGEVLSRDLRWCAEELNRSVTAHDDGKIRSVVKEWEENPRCFPLGNFDGASITIGSSPRFPMYDNDFGWGRPVAVRSGRANKFDGKISAFPGREGSGSVDLEVILSPETMAAVESDREFMRYVSKK
ncbi:PREDICTED: BAHD acyltransferase DCR [Tarenaya hassleriana]|uniref:BAHD acyltransferase DCR n=1 Tax=Tarenaya hassleriana TaxID=28532 RepID=UPI00053C5B9C|nr:PREDICTED: BAHD acyltransferase DCR [Tarenaya hassleriana]